jgi:hypothetical protein
MKPISQLILPVLLMAVALIPGRVWGLGSDYFTNRVDNPFWPQGIAGLVNTTNRVHGFFVNEEDIFFFRGDPTGFEAFLDAYSRIGNVAKHEVVLHEGAGEAKSPWAKTGKPCDWSLYVCPQSWLALPDHVPATGTNSAAVERSVATNYVVTVNFWTGGAIPFDRVKVPANVKVIKAAR